MTRAALILAVLLPLGLTPAPATAQNSDLDEGRGLMEEGALLLFRGLLQQMQPENGEPSPLVPMAQLAQLARLIGDLSDYEIPERLPNGDILIRRKPDAPPLDAADPESEVDL